MSGAAICMTCRHWSPRTTPAWAWREMRMAVCVLRNTKAITMGARSTCPKHAPARADVVAERVQLVGTDSAQGVS